MEIDQEQEEDAEKAPFINLSELKNTNFSMKKPMSNRHMAESGSWEKNSDNHINSKASLYIPKTNYSKVITDNDKYREFLLKSITKQN